MSTPEAEAVDERLAIFEDEADINDWIEVMCGAAMVLLGLFHMFSPGDLVDPDTMRWFAATVTAAGLVWIGHGLKDMVVKDLRRSMVMMDLSGAESPITASSVTSFSILRPTETSCWTPTAKHGRTASSPKMKWKNCVPSKAPTDLRRRDGGDR